MSISVKERIIGSLLGLAVGDALGTVVEAQPPNSFSLVTGMIGGGKFSLAPGEWTDDTSMALCLCESLIECQGYNPVDQNKRYWRWYQEGHLSSNGECFDIGKTVRKALHTFERSRETEPYPGSTAEGAAGNGSLMRLCPVSLLYHRHPQPAMVLSRESSRTTHGAKAALDACSYFAGLLVGCLQGVSKDDLLSSRYSPVPGYWDLHPMVAEVDAVAAGSFKQLEPPDIKASGYVVRSLESVLWAFYHSSDFEEGCLKVVNLGDDADTVGAIYGQLAGAYYGVGAVPEDWKQHCSLSVLIDLFAEEIFQFSLRVEPPGQLPYPASTDWSKVNTPVPVENLSAQYRNIKLSGYDLLEKRNRDIVRKVNPCPKQYKMLEAFDADVQGLVEDYRALPKDSQSEALLSDFQRRWALQRERLALRVSRGRI